MNRKCTVSVFESVVHYYLSFFLSEYRLSPFLVMYPVIFSHFQRIYVVGSNNDETKFRILKIHRNEPRDLIMEDDMVRL